jgi:glutathione S-transferase
MVLYNSWVELSDRSKPAFERLMRDKFGAAPFAEWPVPTDQQFEGFEASMARVAEALDKNGSRNGYFVGESITYADLAVGAHIEWFRRMLATEQFERLLEMNQGRWKKLLDELAEYTYVDEGEVYRGQRI